MGDEADRCYDGLAAAVAAVLIKDEARDEGSAQCA